MDKIGWPAERERYDDVRCASCAHVGLRTSSDIQEGVVESELAFLSPAAPPLPLRSARGLLRGPPLGVGNKYRLHPGAVVSHDPVKLREHVCMM